MSSLVPHIFPNDAGMSVRIATSHALAGQAVDHERTCAPSGAGADGVEVAGTVHSEPAKSDAARKAELILAVREAKAAAAHAVMPPAHLKLLSLDAVLVMHKPAGERTRADNAALARHADVQARLFSIQRHATVLEAEIDALAPEQYAAWRVMPFPA